MNFVTGWLSNINWWLMALSAISLAAAVALGRFERLSSERREEAQIGDELRWRYFGGRS